MKVGNFQDFPAPEPQYKIPITKSAGEPGIDPVQMAIAFVTSRPFVTSNIIGATSIEQLATILGSVNVKITPELEAEINAIHQIHSNPAP